jgi:hypothetical protein
MWETEFKFNYLENPLPRGAHLSAFFLHLAVMMRTWAPRAPTCRHAHKPKSTGVPNHPCVWTTLSQRPCPKPPALHARSPPPSITRARDNRAIFLLFELGRTAVGVLHRCCSPSPSVIEPPQEGVHRQDQLEWFSAKREHNQHTKLQYHILKFK